MKVLWFSRHRMSEEQHNALGNAHITQVNGTMPNVHVPFATQQIEGEGLDPDSLITGTSPALKDLVKDFDMLAIVAPVGLQQQILAITDKPVLMARNLRERNEDGSYSFIFEGWEQLLEVKVVTRPWPVLAV